MIKVNLGERQNEKQGTLITYIIGHELSARYNSAA